MKNLHSFIFAYCFLFHFSLLAQNTDVISKEIEPYVEFLKNQFQDPVDYIFELYKKNDIVILGERDHRDTTQYDLILKLIADNRFIENVGNIFLEVGTITQSDSLQNLLRENMPDSAFIKRLVSSN